MYRYRHRYRFVYLSSVLELLLKIFSLVFILKYSTAAPWPHNSREMNKSINEAWIMVFVMTPCAFPRQAPSLIMQIKEVCQLNTSQHRQCHRRDLSVLLHTCAIYIQYMHAGYSEWGSGDAYRSVELMSVTTACNRHTQYMGVGDWTLLRLNSWHHLDHHSSPLDRHVHNGKMSLVLFWFVILVILFS